MVHHLRRLDCEGQPGLLDELYIESTLDHIDTEKLKSDGKFKLLLEAEFGKEGRHLVVKFLDEIKHLRSCLSERGNEMAELKLKNQIMDNKLYEKG